MIVSCTLLSISVISVISPKFYLLTSITVNNSVYLDVSGDNGLHLLLKNYRRFVIIKNYNNIKLNGPGIRLVNDSVQSKLCKWRQ